jgi:hypothetical protein
MLPKTKPRIIRTSFEAGKLSSTEICAPSTKEIEHAVCMLGFRPDILVLVPHDLEDIFISIMDIAKRVN